MPDPRNQPKTRVENSAPILRVRDMKTALHYWGDDNFTCVHRDAAGIYLCSGSQGSPNTWIWIGVQDVEALYEEYSLSGAKVRHEPQNCSWALEMHVEDADGHVIRLGSEPISDRPFDDWME